jgi:NAD(P)-dependent dehydrogenase (short-subunit alcohol dehydrogenase family)
VTTLTGHVALITGGNSGIGLGMAEGLARAGSDVAIWGTSERKNAAAAEQLGAHGTRVEALVCDVSDEAATDAAFAETVERLGKVDSCFANAGTGGGGVPFQDITLDEWRRVTGVNLDGTFLTFRAAARHMIERGGGGSLVATSSLTAVEAAPRSEHYAASKAGLLGLVRSLAVELARHRIRVNALMPGWVETAFTAPLLSNEAASSRILPRIPLRRYAQPGDFGSAAVFLADPAAAYHTGDTMVVDGAYRLF